jgi:hypothetical protein
MMLPGLLHGYGTGGSYSLQKGASPINGVWHTRHKPFLTESLMSKQGSVVGTPAVLDGDSGSFS